MQIKHRKLYHITTLFLAVALLFTLTAAGWQQAYAYEEKSAVVTVSGTLNVRSGPGTSYSKIGSLSNGAQVTVIGEDYASDGALWYQITCSSVTGYVHSDYITLAEYEYDEDFEAMIADFPDSYKDDLRTLHALYPNWVFVPVSTGTDWEDAVEAESALGVSLISSGSISSWKSTQSGAYNWTTSTWVGLDGSSWVQASEEIIAYYMDPRNYLDSTYIFAFLDYAYDVDTQTAEGLERIVSGTFLAGSYTEGGTTYSYVDVLMDVAAQTEVNPYVLATIICNEIGSAGTSNSISGTVSGYEGLYNYYNIGAYVTSTMTAIQRGLWFAGGSGVGSTSYSRPWNTRTAAILGGAQFYASNYVATGQNTVYLKKFNVISGSTYSLYTHQYMTNVQGASSEAYTLSKAYDETTRAEALVFEIPVYDNMPEEAVSKPTGDGSPNNKLSALSVDSYSLTPTFQMDTESYDVVVDAETTQITITATAADSTATVSGTGTFQLESGVNTFEVVVTAENGAIRTYEINVAGSAGSSTTVTATIDTSFTVTDGMIHGLQTVPMSVTAFIDELGVSDGSAVVLDASGNARTSGNVCTGDTVQILNNDGSVQEEFILLIYGDANGDGKLSSTDLLRIQKHILNTSTLTGAALEAADANRDGKVSSSDLLRLQKAILNTGTITQ